MCVIGVCKIIFDLHVDLSLRITIWNDMNGHKTNININQMYDTHVIGNKRMNYVK